MDSPNESASGHPKRIGSSLGGLDLRHVGVLAALPGELGPFLPPAVASSEAPSEFSSGPVERLGPQMQLGLPLYPLSFSGEASAASLRVTSAVSGVGKVAGAHAAAALIASGVEALFVVGTCGGLDPAHAVGELIHLFQATQWDLSVRAGRHVSAHRGLSEAWLAQTGGRLGGSLTADQPVLGWRARWRAARAARSGFPSHEDEAPPEVPVADMETAAAGRVAEAAGVPWAALRVISDAQRTLGSRILGLERHRASFKANYAAQASRPAETLWRWLSEAGQKEIQKTMR